MSGMGDTQSREAANVQTGVPMNKRVWIRPFASKELEYAKQRKQFYERKPFYRRFFKRGLKQANNAIRAYEWAQQSGNYLASVREGVFTVAEIKRLAKTAKYTDQKVMLVYRRKRRWTKQAEMRLTRVKQWLENPQHSTPRLAILVRHPRDKLDPNKDPAAHVVTIVLDKTTRSIEFYDPNGTPNMHMGGGQNLYTPAVGSLHWNAVRTPLPSIEQLIYKYGVDEEFGTTRLDVHDGLYHLSTLQVVRRILQLVGDAPWKLLVQNDFHQHRGWCSVLSMLFAHFRGLGIDREEALRLANDKREQMQLIAFVKGNPKQSGRALHWANTTPRRRPKRLGGRRQT